MSGMRFTRMRVTASTLLAGVVVFTLLSGLLGWLLEPQGDRLCAHLGAERTPIVGAVEHEVCLPAI